MENQEQVQVLKNALLEEYTKRRTIEMFTKEEDTYINNMKEEYPDETAEIDLQIALEWSSQEKLDSYDECDSACEEEKQESIPTNRFSIGTLKVMLEVLLDDSGRNFLERIKQRYTEVSAHLRSAGGAMKYTKEELDKNESILLDLSDNEMQILRVLLA